jgi:hypothetical protein
MVKSLMSLPVINILVAQCNSIEQTISLPFSKRLLIFSYRERPEKILRWSLLSNCLGKHLKGQGGSPIGERPFVQYDSLKFFGEQVFTFK